MADYQQNFLNALQGGMQVGQQLKGIQDQRQLNQLAGQAYGTPRDQRQSLLGQLATISPQAAAAQRKQWSADDEADQQELVNMARFIKAAPPEQQAAAYSSILPKLRERGMQAPDWTPETQQTILQTVDALVGAYGGGQAGVGVQSTFIDDQGNRVAILRDGSTQVLGRNAPSTQIIEGEGGFYGVNKGNLQAAPVVLGGAPQAGGAGLPQRAGTPQETDAVAARLNAYRDQLMQAGVQGEQLNAALDAAEQQLFGGIAPPAQPAQQLRPAPKAETRETFSQPQAVTGPDGTIRYVQFGNQGSTREVQGYGAPPTDRDAKPPTEGERKAATLLQRLTGSLSQLEQAVRENPDAASPNLAAEAARRLPFVGEAAANTITPAARQRVEAAQLDILDAALTLGTGAAYTREQLEGYRRSYFPQIGDSDATVRDKQARLSNVIEAAKIAAGRAAPGNPERAAPADDIDSLLELYR